MMKMRWKGAATGMQRNKTFVIIVECYVSNGKFHRTPCRQNLPLHFSPLHVLERSTVTPILPLAPVVTSEGGGGSVVSVARRVPLGREGAPGKDDRQQ